MGIDERSQDFLRRLMAEQPRLYAYVVSLLAAPDRAHDVLQKANVVLMEKMSEHLATGQEFLPWAFKVCSYEVLADRRDRARDRLRFDPALLDVIAEESARRLEHFGTRQAALEGCLAKLAPNQRDLVLRRYAEGGSVEGLAAELGRTPASVSQTLYRLREVLLECIRRSTASEGTA
jgi:RNA polymerase sigma-70 factor (ECF subfamily)